MRFRAEFQVTRREVDAAGGEIKPLTEEKTY